MKNYTQYESSKRDHKKDDKENDLLSDMKTKAPKLAGTGANIGTQIGTDAVLSRAGIPPNSVTQEVISKPAGQVVGNITEQAVQKGIETAEEKMNNNQNDYKSPTPFNTSIPKLRPKNT